MYFLDELAKYDKEVYDATCLELQRQRELRSGMVSIACSETALHAVLLQVLSRFPRE